MKVQLRRYRIREGKLRQFVEGWKSGVVPLREKFGFMFLGAWTLPESNEFVWVIGYEGDFEAADRSYYESSERKRLSPDPARYIIETDHSAAEVVL